MNSEPLLRPHSGIKKHEYDIDLLLANSIETQFITPREHMNKGYSIPTCIKNYSFSIKTKNGCDSQANSISRLESN